jgi:hypothetical protein
MSTQQTPESEPRNPGLTPRAQARLYEIKARNAMVVAISNESWGGKLTPIQQRAFAEYMRTFHLDISEVDNLGGRPYRNGRYYMRRTAELASEGRVEWYKGEHIGPDARLDAMAKAGDQWAIDEKMRRLRECIRLAIPAEATYAYVVTVKMKELSTPTEGAKWYVPGRQKMGWSKEVKGKREMVSADPVGDENPITSVETRAWRRAGRLYAAEIPELRDQEAYMEYEASETQKAVIAEAERADEVDTAATITPGAFADVPHDDPYGIQPAAIGAGPAQPIVVPTREAVPVGRTQAPAQSEDVEYIDDTDIVD